jgi:hypothetical protein
VKMKLLGSGKANSGVSSEYDRVTEAIRIYQESVNDALGSLKRNAIIDILFISLTAALIILSIFFSNLPGILTTLGLGGVTAYSQGQSWISTLKVYVNDSSALRRGLNRIKEQLALCEKNDTECLNKVKCLIEQQFDALDLAAKK